MTGPAHDDPVQGTGRGNWLITAWVVPLAIAAGITVVTAGFGAITIAVAVAVGLVATALHFVGRRDSRAGGPM